jgi:hypothetical protein
VEEVASAQAGLGKNLEANVMDGKSRTSLQLTLEHKKVVEAVDGYVKGLEPSLEKQTDVIGYAVAINGKVINADVYASAGQFRKLWPKPPVSSCQDPLDEAALGPADAAGAVPAEEADVSAVVLDAHDDVRRHAQLLERLHRDERVVAGRQDQRRHLDARH